MRTNEERQQLIHRRTVEIQRERRRKKQNIIAGTGIGLCLLFIVGVGGWMSDMSGQISVAKIDYATGMASMLGHYEALGYICIGILSFALGVCVTILLYRLRKMEEHIYKEEKYKKEKYKEEKYKQLKRNCADQQEKKYKNGEEENEF